MEPVVHRHTVTPLIRHLPNFLTALRLFAAPLTAYFILHGRYTCIARKPLCPVCVVRDLCRFKDKTKELPPEKPKAATKSLKTKTSRR